MHRGIRPERWIAAALWAVWGAAAARASPVTLPIEVTGLPGTQVTVAVPLNAGSQPVTLQLYLNDIEYPGEAAVQVGQGAWVPVSRTAGTFDPTSTAWGGVGGPIANCVFTMPVQPAAFAGGTALLSFQFLQSDGVCSGFRVISLNLVDTHGVSCLAPGALVQDDPTTWEPPLPDAADISAGQQLWETAPLVASYLPGAQPIGAHCGDCHAPDGRDLAYFAYSNASIEARCQFHGLTAAQGQQVASYIRSLPIQPLGRPWNPPYQPGPGLDGKTVAHWAAGAGWQDVLPADSGSLPYVPASAWSATGYLNMRQTPIALPLPTWNQWLPRIWPGDFWGSAFLTSALYQDWLAMSAQFAGMTLQQWTYYIAYLNGTSHARSAFYSWNNNDGGAFVMQNVFPIASWTPQIAEGVYSTSKWRMTRMWSWMQDYNLEEFASLAFPIGPQVESRSWLSSTAFDTSPLSQHIPEKAGECVGGEPRYQHYFSDAWYQLQTVLDPGQGDPGLNSTFPVDWGYDYGALVHSAELSHLDTGVRMSLNILKATQECALFPPGPSASGWSPQHSASPLYLINGSAQVLAQVASGSRAALENQLVSEWFAEVQAYPNSVYYASHLASTSDVPRLGTQRFVDVVYTILYRGQLQGMDATLLGQIRAWARALWPNGGF